MRVLDFHLLVMSYGCVITSNNKAILEATNLAEYSFIK